MDFNIKEKIGTIKEQLGDDAEKVGSILVDIERHYSDNLDALKHANGESKERRIKLREYESQLSDYEAQVEMLKNDTKVKELEEQIGKLKGFQSEVFKQNREVFKTKFEKIKDHKNFEKIKDKIITIPEKDGKYDFDSIENDTINSMLEKVNEYESIGLFESKKIDTPGGTPIAGESGSDGKYTIEGQEMTLAEIANRYPEKYKEIRLKRKTLQFDK